MGDLMPSTRNGIIAGKRKGFTVLLSGVTARGNEDLSRLAMISRSRRIAWVESPAEHPA